MHKIARWHSLLAFRLHLEEFEGSAAATSNPKAISRY
jgi:hypothetical protein